MRDKGQLLGENVANINAVIAPFYIHRGVNMGTSARVEGSVVGVVEVRSSSFHREPVERVHGYIDLGR